MGIVRLSKDLKTLKNHQNVMIWITSIL